MDPITTLIVDDHTVAREGLRAMLETSQEIQVVGEAADGLEAMEKVEELHPRVVLMDIRMPRLDGLQATRQIKGKHPTTSVILLSSYGEDALVIDAVRAGAAGYLMKDVSRDLLSHTITAVGSGGILIKASLLRKAIDALATAAPAGEINWPDETEVEALSQREKEILSLLAEGYTNKEIGNALALAEVTAKKHVQNIIAKLQASDRTHAAIKGLRLGLIK